MTLHIRRPGVGWPGTERITLALLAVLPGVMAYPWRSTRDQWVLGVAACVVVVLLGWWRGLYLTTILRRRVAVARRHRKSASEASIDVKTTALLRVWPLVPDAHALPLPLIAGYLNRYGIRAQKIRITNRDIGTDVWETWIGLTVSAVDNLAALQARSPRIPLHQTTEVAARRLADHLREVGWAASVAGPDDVPPLVARSARETWRGVLREVSKGSGDYVAAYRITVDDALSDTLAAIRSYPARETWTALEIADGHAGRTLAAACAFRTGERHRGAGPLAGLIPQHGNHRTALMTLNPLSTQRLDGHTGVPGDLLARLRWRTVTHSLHAAHPGRRFGTRPRAKQAAPE
ncbi:type VII secretion protein EccE [Mycobacterium lacus]|uniref:Type VII secretion protein EccE n=1 Tax=Mycobacterium lacus TaxID=169765 RepID=A0A7I7NRT7_9MYCO|nr:type VII secretion protein EccE [Mycobacterium lacus]